MALIGNITALSGYYPMRHSSYHGCMERSQAGDIQGPQFGKYTNVYMAKQSGLPNGYRPPYCWRLPMKTGGLATYTTIAGTSDVDDALLAAGRAISATIPGTCTVEAAISAIAALGASLPGIGSLVGDIAGAVWMRADIDGSGAVTGDISGPASISSDIYGIGEITAAAIAAGFQLTAALDGSGALVADVSAVAQLLADIAGNCTVVSSLTAGRYIFANLDGSSSIVADILGKAGISADLSGSSSAAGDISAEARLAATFGGVGTIDNALLAGGIFIGSSMSGSGSLATGISAPARISCLISIGALPSAREIADAVWASVASAFTFPDTMGRKLNDAGAGGTPLTEQQIRDCLALALSLGVIPAEGSIDKQLENLAAGNSFKLGASMSDDGTTSFFVLWLDTASGPDLTITSITARVLDRSGDLLVDLGSGVGPDANGCFEFSCASFPLPYNEALYVTATATDGTNVYHGNLGVTRVK